MSIGTSSFSASGETRVVLDAYEDFKRLLETASAPPRALPTGKKHGGDQAASKDGDADSTPAVVKTPTSLPLKPYLKRLKLRGNKEKATAIVAWSGESGKKAAVTISEIEQLWKKTPFKTPANLARDVRNAEAEGWLDSQGKAGSSGTTYSINGYGEGIAASWIQTPQE